MIYDQIFLIFQILFASLLGLSVNLTYQKLGYEWAANKNQKIIHLFTHFAFSFHIIINSMVQITCFEVRP